MDAIQSPGPGPRALPSTSADTSTEDQKVAAKKQDEQKKTDEQKRKQRDEEILNPVDRSLIDRSSLGKNIADSLLSAVIG
ncbi:MAG: hypothetical protein AABZ74_08060 [Cyanobacteriota bacterium]